MKKLKFITLFVFVPFALAVQAQTKKPAIPKKATTTKSGTAASVTNGKIIYNKYCITCHQVDGGGVPNMNPPLSQTSYVLGDKKRLVQVILKGLDSGVEIDGETYSNSMASFNFLTDQQIADVLTFVRGSFGNKASAISPSEVKAIRSARK